MLDSMDTALPLLQCRTCCLHWLKAQDWLDASKQKTSNSGAGCETQGTDRSNPVYTETWLEAPVRNFENVAESCFYKCFFSILLMDFGQTLLEAHTCVKHKPSI